MRQLVKKNLDNFYNVRNFLFDKKLSIQSMETTKNLKSTLDEVVKACDILRIDMDSFNEMKDNYEDMKMQNEEIKSTLIDYSNDKKEKDVNYFILF
jgi:hypothetical protein